MLAGMMARPRATSDRTNSGVISFGIAAPKTFARMLLAERIARKRRSDIARPLSRIAMNSISGVMMPCRA